MAAMMMTSLFLSWGFAVDGSKTGAGSQPAAGTQLQEDEPKDTDTPVDVPDASGGADAEDVTDAAQQDAAGSASQDAAADDEPVDVQGTPSGTSGDVDVDATSETNNIVGDVFANQIKTADDEEAQKEREASLEEYPLEPRDLEDYGNSQRVRMIEGGDEEGSNYLVYRDSFLLIPEKSGSKYEVVFSEDGTKATVSPAIPADKLEGKTGIVFIRDDIGNDDILVFDGEPVYDDENNSMTVPVKEAEDITVNELFSDGKLAVEDTGKNRKRLKGAPSIAFDIDPEGTNWKGKITSFRPEFPTAHVEVDVWQLLFELDLDMRFNLDFEITTFGASDRETKTIAGVSIPIKLFTISIDYNLQTEFGEAPIFIKGTLVTDFTIGFGTHGTRIREYRNPVKVKSLVLRDQSYANTDIRFYIGSQLAVQGGFLGIKLNLGVYKLSIGPVFSINMEMEGGCRMKARLNTDKYDWTDNMIHSCSVHGKTGCLDLEAREVQHKSLYVKIDLFFDDWEFPLADTGEVDLDTKYYYDSYTYGSGIREGICPHKMYRVPVHVQSQDGESIPDMDVTSLDKLDVMADENQYVKGITGADGNTNIFLPFRRSGYTITAGGRIGGVDFSGSGRMSPPEGSTNTMVRGLNSRVVIVLRSEKKVGIDVSLKWNIDAGGKEVPIPESDGTYNGRSIEQFVIERRIAGTGDWEKYDLPGHEGYPGSYDTFTLIDVYDWTPAYSMDNFLEKYTIQGGKPVMCEYRARIFDPEGNKPVLEESGEPYIYHYHGAYTNDAGEYEFEGKEKYLVGYSDDHNVEDGKFKTEITETVIRNVEVKKNWLVSGEKPTEAYIALECKPEKGWGDKAMEKGMADEWRVVQTPLMGGTMTVGDLDDEGMIIMADAVPSVENLPLAITKYDESNDWKTSYTVPKFVNGIKMQYRGIEIDDYVMENLFNKQFGLNTLVSVRQFGNYDSVPGKACSSTNFWDLKANVINKDPGTEKEITGTVRWEPDGKTKPASIKLHIMKDGTEIAESPLTLNTSDYEGQDTWIWTLPLDDYSADAEYTVTEEIDSKNWVYVADGLDVLNTWRDDSPAGGMFFMVKASFADGGANYSGTSLTTTLKDKTSGKTKDVKLQKASGWNSGGESWLSDVKDIGNYELEAPEISHYVRVYKDPEKIVDSRDTFYVFTVYYVPQEQLAINVSKEWKNTDVSTVYPEKVTAGIYRDDERVADVTLERNGSEWSTASVSEDFRGDPLYRTSESGHRYIYTIREDPADGFSFTEQQSDNGSTLSMKLINTWVGSDHVNLKGQVKWEGDEDKEKFRPDAVSLSVINSNYELVKTISVPTDGDGRYEAKYLPSVDKDGNPLTYSVSESHVPGYTTTYDTSYDDITRTWECNITNTLTGYYAIKIKKNIEGIPDNENEEYRFSFSRKEPGGEAGAAGSYGYFPLPENNDDLTIKGKGETKAEFIIDQYGMYLYTVEEKKGSDTECRYDDKKYQVLIVKSRDEKGKPEFRSYVVNNDNETVADIIEDYGTADTEADEKVKSLESDTVTFTNSYPNIQVEKKWDIDLAGTDRPDSVQAVVQKQKDGKWENLKTVELSSENHWKAKVNDPDRSKDAKYRVRELKPQTAGSPTVSKRIVYDKGDSDKPSGDDGDGDPETNTVRYLVGDHHTKYQVSYDGNTQDGVHSFSITNKAIVEVDVIKRWLTFGVDDEDIPDSAWLVLMCTPKADALDAAKAAGADLGGVLDYEFPVINPIKGGNDPISIISELVLGVDINIFSKLGIIPKLAIAKATKTEHDGVKSWTVHFTDSKYHMGIPVEYKGAELSSEIIRQIIKYVSKGTVNLPVSYNPFSNYFSIPTKAIRTILGITDVDQILDFSGLTKKMLEKAKNLTVEDIKNFGPETLLDDDQLMANVINVKVDFDTDSDDPDDEKITISGSKTWDDSDDQAGKRPESITVRLRADGKETDSRTVTADEGWKWEFRDLPKTEDGRKIRYTVSEDAVEGYQTSVNGADITNTYSNESPGKTQVNVFKVWDDHDNLDGIRPEKVSVKLKADGSDTDKIIELSESNNWTGSFTGLDVKDGSGKPIDYSVAEVTTDVITGTDGKGTYASEISGDASKGFTITNKHTSERVTISGTKIWDDDNDKTGLRPEKIKIHLLANGSEVSSVETTREGRWKFFFADQPRKDDQGKDIEYGISEDEVEGYTTEIVKQSAYKFSITNKLRPRINIDVSKLWDDNNDQDGIRPKSVTVKLYANGEDSGKALTLSDTDQWKDSFEGLYKEDKTGKTITYTVEEVKTGVITGTDAPGAYGISTNGSADDGFVITNKHTPETVTLSGKKTWDDNDDQDGQRPESIKVHLYANGEETASRTVTSSDGWAWEFKDMPKYRDGSEISYVLTEDLVDDYTSSVNGMDVTNRHTPGKTQVTVFKWWSDDLDADGLRPDFVTVHLLADGKETGRTAVISDASDWMGTFTGLDKKKAGKEIIYSVKEDPVTGYETEIIDGRQYESPNTFIIKNTHKAETVTVEGKKIWDDDNDRDRKRPEKITIRLYWDGTPVAHREVTAADGWKWSFGEFRKNHKGEPYSFTISEDKVEDYVSEIRGNAVSGFTVTNKHMPGRTQVNVTGLWDDENDQDGIRPDKVTVRLLADGKDTGKTLDLTAKDNWTGTFTALYKKAAGKDIRYTVEQVSTKVLTGTDGPGTYACVTDGDAESGFTICNIHTPERISLSGTKTWDDDNDRDGKRPDSITVRLRSDGTEVGSRTVTESDGWKWTFDGLPKYKDGQVIRYFLTEDIVGDYTSSVSGMNVSNEYTPGKTQVNVYKMWDDLGDNDGKRPGRVKVQLYADGADTGKSLVLDEDNGWMGSFTDINKYRDGGVLIDYTIEEDPVDGYETSYVRGEDDQSDSWLIVNRHEAEKISIAGTKVWDDDNDRDGLRPDSITVNLYFDDNLIGKKEVTAKDEWKWSFDGYFRYLNGKELKYTVTEEPVENYETAASGDSQNGFTVTNTYSPKKMSVKVSKVWDDVDDHDGIRPRSVTVRLLADGADTGLTKRLSWINGWKSSFDDLYVNSDGKKITYTVEETADSVITGKDDDGTYASEVSGNAADGFTVRNIHTPWYTIDYDLNGGSYQDSKSDILERYKAGAEISIHEAPVRDGYTFLYWKGSEYQPGDKYTVTEDHKFVAQWKKNTVPDNNDDGGDPDPDDPDKPDKPDSPDDPDSPHRGVRTGDESFVFLWSALSVSSLLMLVILLELRRRRSE